MHIKRDRLVGRLGRHQCEAVCCFTQPTAMLKLHAQRIVPSLCSAHGGPSEADR